MEIAVVLLLLGLVLGGQVLLFSKYLFRNFRYRCSFDRQEVFEGEQIQMVETVMNGKALPIPYLRADIVTSRFLEFADTESSLTDESRFVPSFFMLKGYQKITRRWKVTCARRGELGVRSISLVSSDLLGLRTLSQSFPGSARVLVLPAPAPLEGRFISPRMLQGEFSLRRTLLEDPFTVSGVREYQPSDPLNRVHWAATAKTGDIMVRHYDCTNRQNLTIVLNMQTGPNERGLVNHPEQVEEGIKICAALIQQAVAGSIPLRFATNASTQQEERSLLITPEFSSQEGALELLRVLARLQVRSTRHIVDLFQQLDQQAVSSDLVLVTAYMDEDISVFASRLSQQWGARLQVLVLDYDKGRDWGQELELYYLRRETPFASSSVPKEGIA